MRIGRIRAVPRERAVRGPIGPFAPISCSSFHLFRSVPDQRLRDHPDGQIYDGREEVERYFRESRTAFPDQRNELIALHHADDAVITEFWLRGTHKGPLLGIEPTGRGFECRMTAFFLFDGASLVCERVYFDAATILRQLTA